ncbi:MAG TPA: hypothetical protein PKE47_06765, partial [Verrucomicrobiota bacterium]|nr:hypothetical protein [Verrucomicrobiota bacterium]
TGELLGDLQGFWLFDDFAVPIQGCEVFSLLRESDLEPRQYLKAFFATGFERQQPYGAKADAASGVAPEASAGCSCASDGPPSAN